jgi:hypothetical protein
MTNYEQQYIKETGEAIPTPENYNAETYYNLLAQWYEGFSTWLSEQLERAEKENEQINLELAQERGRKLCVNCGNEL